MLAALIMSVFQQLPRTRLACSGMQSWQPAAQGPAYPHQKQCLSAKQWGRVDARGGCAGSMLRDKADRDKQARLGRAPDAPDCDMLLREAMEAW
jgi:hypothetical protein